MSFDTEKARDTRRPFHLVELDLDLCTRTYGTAPCVAAIGTTGTVKCYNTRATCQDSANFAKTVRTHRFCSNVADMPRDLSALPFIESVSITPTKLQIGSGLGARGGVTIVLRDGKHDDVGLDPYVTERTYDPLTQGTYFGRLLARNSYYLGRPLRVLSGYLVDSASGAPTYDATNFETRTYFIEKIAGPDPSGRVTISAKDILKLADDDRAKAPRQALGRIDAAITAGTAAPIVRNLLPAGVGAEYEASGKVRLNGEIFTFTRAADAITLTARAQNNTVAADHAIDDAVQECLVFTSQLSHQMIYTLLTEYAGIDADYIPLADWVAEDDAYNERLYNAVISEPTGVNQLIGEVCEQGPAYVWWDEIAAQIVYRALRPAASATSELDDDSNFVAGSVQVQDRLDLRISECWVYFGQRDPTEPVDKRSNYAAVYVLVGDGETVNKYNQPRVREIFARFLTSSARTFASEIADSVIQRYDDVPKQIDFTILPKDAIGTGDLFRGSTRLVQGADGSAQTVVAQVLSSAPDLESDTYRISALQERYTPSSTSGRRILTISANEFDYNLRERHDELYAAPTEAVEVELNVLADTITGSTSTATPAFDVGDWPTGTTITIYLLGRIQGRGGDGGDVTASGSATERDGLPGGPALKARFPLTINCASGSPQIWSGGGGGGASNTVVGAHGGGGGGGAGQLPGDGGTVSAGLIPGASGTSESGGNPGGSSGTGYGGGPGLDGLDGINELPGPTPAGGAAGDAIDGVSYITFVGSADIRGDQIN